MSANLYSKLIHDSSYKLVQLAPDLLETLENTSQSEIKFKAVNNEKSDVVLCSKNKTWLIKEKHHSNTVMLLREFVATGQQTLDEKSLFGMPQPINDLLAFSRTTSEYETRPAKGLLNIDHLPIYNGDVGFPTEPAKLKFKTLDDVLDNSPASELESFTRWNLLGGCIVNGFPCLLSAEFLSNALHVTLMSVMAESLDLDSLTIKDTFEAVNKDMSEGSNPYTKKVIETVLRKYGTKLDKGEKEDKENWKLDRQEISRWYGIRALRKYATKPSLPMEEFLVKWKSTFPPFSPFNIEMKMLGGWYFQPIARNIQYVSKDTLPTDIKERFKMLFRLQSQWDLENIIPFVDELNTKGLKPDIFVMKYARKKRVGKRYIVSSR
ncbi:hypothetical protein HG535_0B04310 [Zygotorulaspora mrakii]|uniref:Sister chromatid cohesion protein DCC1 n=1 Tax=Zygotorulaspora mrakii TaxID=42260 RepID=A0A7H9B085_ZYGMR|nr:uncharacterized protein HG535_0B04310 [Zygotorulaspora mrakii]QLG71389.1 hypothetical protein HG535_0B04310 [Zygotorulaspora mrakii]